MVRVANQDSSRLRFQELDARIGLVLIFYTKKTPYADAFQQIIFGCPRNKLVFEVRLLSPRFELERFLVRLSGLV